MIDVDDDGAVLLFMHGVGGRIHMTRVWNYKEPGPSVVWPQCQMYETYPTGDAVAPIKNPADVVLDNLCMKCLLLTVGYLYDLRGKR